MSSQLPAEAKPAWQSASRRSCRHAWGRIPALALALGLGLVLALALGLALVLALAQEE